MIFSDYNLIKVFNNSDARHKYLMENKHTKEKYFIKVISYKYWNRKTKEEFSKTFKKFALLHIDGILNIPIIKKNKNEKLFYIFMRPSSDISLKKIRNNLTHNQSGFPERAIWKIAYQCCYSINQVLKCTKTKYFMLPNYISINLESVYVDSDWNVKMDLFNFNQLEGDYAQSVSSQIGTLIWDLLAVNHHQDQVSKDLCKFVDYLFKNSTISLDDILINSYLVLNYINAKNVDVLEVEEKLKGLEVKEKILAEKERLLFESEKKIALKEQMVQKKLTQAEEYLKRNRRVSRVKTIDDDLNNTLSGVSCDTTILPTSNKSDFKRISKQFVRSHSERRVNFKKPLQSIDENVKNSTKRTLKRQNSFVEMNKENHFNNVLEHWQNMRGVVSDSVPTSSSEGSTSMGHCSRSIEFKKQAFTLLRLMDSKENINATFKLPVNAKTSYL